MLKKEETKKMFWLDLEMTGLDPNKDHILECACLITDPDLKIIAKGPEIVIHQSETVLNNMNDWCKKHHKESGLIERVKNSNTSIEEAEELLLNFIKTHSGPQEMVMAGSSIHVDKSFMVEYMPRLIDYLHYRLIDVSTVKELVRNWCPASFKNSPQKKEAHRALDDILESIIELKYYKSCIFDGR